MKRRAIAPEVMTVTIYSREARQARIDETVEKLFQVMDGYYHTHELRLAYASDSGYRNEYRDETRVGYLRALARYANCDSFSKRERKAIQDFLEAVCMPG